MSIDINIASLGVYIMQMEKDVDFFHDFLSHWSQLNSTIWIGFAKFNVPETIYVTVDSQNLGGHLGMDSGQFVVNFSAQNWRLAPVLMGNSIKNHPSVPPWISTNMIK